MGIDLILAPLIALAPSKTIKLIHKPYHKNSMKLLKTILYSLLWLWTVFLTVILLYDPPIENGQLNLSLLFALMAMLALPWGICFGIKRLIYLIRQEKTQANQPPLSQKQLDLKLERANQTSKTLAILFYLLILISAALMGITGTLSWWGSLFSAGIALMLINAFIDAKKLTDQINYEQQTKKIPTPAPKPRPYEDNPVDNAIEQWENKCKEDNQWQDKWQDEDKATRQALFIGHRYEIIYEDTHANHTQRTIRLLSLKTNKRGQTLLESWCEKAHALRTFKLHNIQSLIDLDTGAIIR